MDTADAYESTTYTAPSRSPWATTAFPLRRSSPNSTDSCTTSAAVNRVTELPGVTASVPLKQIHNILDGIGERRSSKPDAVDAAGRTRSRTPSTWRVANPRSYLSRWSRPASRRTSSARRSCWPRRWQQLTARVTVVEPKPSPAPLVQSDERVVAVGEPIALAAEDDARRLARAPQSP